MIFRLNNKLNLFLSFNSAKKNIQKYIKKIFRQMTHDLKFIISTIIFHCVNKTLARIQKKWKSLIDFM